MSCDNLRNPKDWYSAEKIETRLINIILLIKQKCVKLHTGLTNN